MSRFYAVSDGVFVHLSFAPAKSRAWPHLLCNTKPNHPLDSARAPTCLLCIGIAQRYDEQLRETSSTNPCAEVRLGR